MSGLISRYSSLSMSTWNSGRSNMAEKRSSASTFFASTFFFFLMVASSVCAISFSASWRFTFGSFFTWKINFTKLLLCSCYSSFFYPELLQSVMFKVHLHWATVTSLSDGLLAKKFNMLFAQSGGKYIKRKSCCICALIYLYNISKQQISIPPSKLLPRCTRHLPLVCNGKQTDLDSERQIYEILSRGYMHSTKKFSL